ncbi:MAG TPA: ATP-dependent DNA ligase, partial [Acidimicrobiia bacterium]|nr:ATP-dependent DNA ligase [Acidimicrobiia bacterium]
MEVTHPDRLLFPGEGITKGDVIDYYRRIAPVMVAHVRNRPLMLERYRDGIDQGGFYQKEASEYFPPVIRRVEVPKAGGVVHHPVIDSEDGVVYLANQGCLTFHCWP